MASHFKLETNPLRSEAPFVLVVVALPVVGLVVLANMAKGSIGEWHIVLVAVLIVAFAVYRFVRGARSQQHGNVSVGADGLWLERGSKSEMIHWRDVVWFKLGSGNVYLKLGDRSVRFLDVDAPLRLHSAMRTAQQGFEERRGTNALENLNREGTPFGEWLARANAAAARRYRVAPVREERLLEIVEDADQDPTQRLGAVLALGSASPEARHRVRMATQDTVDPNLRAALQAAEDGTLSEDLCASIDQNAL